mmetsp:Transcript_19615/g.45657  ORF Transcript_19615/g.45657 Transcript_19615/m.45657 type:complete len:898 (+) Transcript_19615:54-2747(+)
MTSPTRGRAGDGSLGTIGFGVEDDLDTDPIIKALERSTIHQTLKAARASLAEPSRPYTPLDRSLFQMASSSGETRPSSGFVVSDLSFVRDTYGGSGSGRPDSSRSSRNGGVPATIPEDFDGYSREGAADVLRIDDDYRERGTATGDSEDEFTPTGSGGTGGAAPPPPRLPNRPPKPTGSSGYPVGGGASGLSLRTGGYPPELQATVTGSSPRQRRMHASSPSPEPSFLGASQEATGSSAPGTPRKRWDAECEAVISKLQALAMSQDKKKQNAGAMVELADKLWDLVNDIKAGKGTRPQEFASKLLRAVLGLMDLKDAKAIFRLSRCALVLLQMEGAVNGVQTSGVQAAYLNVAKVLFKCSKTEGHDAEFLKEGLIEQLLGVLESDAPECASNDLQVYVVGVLKNVSHDEANQKFLVQKGAVNVLFKIMSSDMQMGNTKEAQLLIQITATLRNLASHQHKPFVTEEKLLVLTRVMEMFPSQVELLINVSRIFAKLTLHSSPCEALGKSDAHIRQMARTLSANADSAPLVLRLTFVLGNLTAKSDRLRVVYGFDGEGTSLTPQLLGKYWQKDRQLARLEHEKGADKVSGGKETEEVLVKLVRLIANMAISSNVGSTLASSSAVVDPLLDMLGSKKVAESEELVLNVVAAITNLLFYDVPSNLLFLDENKQLLCRLFRPLLLESYNIEALVESARALGNLSRHADARQAMAALRLDEILVILLDHDDRDLVFYVCGALVNLAADPTCTERLMSVCAISQKLVKLLRDAPLDDPGLQLVAIKVLTNLSLDANMSWTAADSEATREALEELSTAASSLEAAEAEEEIIAERQQMLELAQHLLSRLPSQPAAEQTVEKGPLQFICPVEGCGRRFDSEEKLAAHQERRHNSKAVILCKPASEPS